MNTTQQECGRRLMEEIIAQEKERHCRIDGCIDHVFDFAYYLTGSQTLAKHVVTKTLVPLGDSVGDEYLPQDLERYYVNEEDKKSNEMRTWLFVERCVIGFLGRMRKDSIDRYPIEANDEGQELAFSVMRTLPVPVRVAYFLSIRGRGNEEIALVLSVSAEEAERLTEEGRVRGRELFESHS